MSLKQKYTWNDFLKENPDVKTKGIKRRSKEGVKAFESAFKTKMKIYLTDRTKKVDVLKKKALEKRNDLTSQVKTYQKAKNFPKAKIYQEKVGRQDSWITSLSKQEERIKYLQKNL